MHFRNLIVMLIFVSLPAVALSQFEMGHASAANCEVNEPVVQYYRTIAEAVSLVEPVSGVGEVSEDVAMHIAHFRFVSDPCSGRGKIQYFHGNTPKPIDENYTANRFTPSSNITFHRDGLIRSIKYSDHNDRPVSVFGGVRATRLEYDESGKLVAAAFLDSNGDPTTSSMGYATVRWVWRGEHKVTEHRFDGLGLPVDAGVHLQFNKATVTLGKNGFITKIKPNSGDIFVQFKRGEENELIAWRLFDGSTLFKDEDSGLAGIDYHYDQNHYLQMAVYVDENEKPVVARSGHMGFVRTYAESGNRLGYHFIDGNRKIWSPPKRGYAGQKYHWRTDGVVRTRTEYVDHNGRLINHPDRKYAAVEYSFDANNDVTLERYVDAAGTVLREVN